jgi:hypothetical protein
MVQIHLWCLQVPLPKIPTIVVAALAIPNNLNAEQLLVFLDQILDGLLQRNIKIVSYAADGTSIERSVQHLLTRKAIKF